MICQVIHLITLLSFCIIHEISNVHLFLTAYFHFSPFFSLNAVLHCTETIAVGINRFNLKETDQQLFISLEDRYGGADSTQFCDIIFFIQCRVKKNIYLKFPLQK
jgi:hypothetical protein